jgi:hypothetical protein
MSQKVWTAAEFEKLSPAEQDAAFAGVDCREEWRPKVFPDDE